MKTCDNNGVNCDGYAVVCEGYVNTCEDYDEVCEGYDVVSEDPEVIITHNAGICDDPDVFIACFDESIAYYNVISDDYVIACEGYDNSVAQ